MTLTAKIVNFLDKVKIEKLFIEDDKKVSLKLISFNPQFIEKSLNKVLKTNGHFYHMSDFEKEVLRELEHRPLAH